MLGVENYLVNISFVGDITIKHLNKQFRGKDKSTDVLSFPQQNWKKPVPLTKKKGRKVSQLPDVLGDIVICLNVAEKNAKDIGQGLDREVFFLLVHGLLHLCGYDHMTAADEKNMLAAQRRIIDQITKDDTPPLWRRCVIKA